eukprot:COSAG02_NODE_6572_length_3487_cov_3.480519_3_plen_127_part_00
MLSQMQLHVEPATCLAVPVSPCRLCLWSSPLQINNECVHSATRAAVPGTLFGRGECTSSKLGLHFHRPQCAVDLVSFGCSAPVYPGPPTPIGANAHRNVGLDQCVARRKQHLFEATTSYLERPAQR